MLPIDPHGNQPVSVAGVPVETAAAAMILLHGRGASAETILPLAEEFQKARTIRPLAFIAPEAAGSSWYPNSFLAPRTTNEPWLGSALNRIDSLVASLVQSGIGREHILICGFSQGACLATEFVASHPARFGGLISFTGGLVGPLGSDLTHKGRLDGTPAIFLSGDPDPHVPWSRVEESAAVLEQMGAIVETKKFPNRPHTISAREIALAQSFLERVLNDPIAEASSVRTR